MKKHVLLLTLFVICFSANAQSWDYFRDISKYTKFTEKNYRIINKTNIYDEDSNIISRVYPHQSFRSSKFAYVYYPGDDRFVADDMLVFFEAGEIEGWISVDDLVVEKSDVLPASIVSNKNGQTNKKWLPIWFNSILDSGRTLEEYSDYYKRYKGTPEYQLVRIHDIEFRNTVITMHDTGGTSYFSIKNIRQKNNVYYIYCELARNAQAFFNDFDKESFNNLPDLRVRQDAIFIVEQNGNRLRVYNGENYKLIIELMQTNQEWADSMVKYIKSEYKNKPSNLKVLEEKLEHPWSNPVTGLYATSVRSGEAAVFPNVAPNKTMSVKENLKLRSGEATTTSVLAVMSAGTRVKILRLGKQATIDGITSNWVQVEVQAGAKDRDGKAIAAGTTGWCFGGYLAER